MVWRSAVPWVRKAAMAFRGKLTAALLISASVLFLATRALALCDDPGSGDEPTVRIEPPMTYYGRRVAVFPLEIPGYLIKALTSPIGLGLNAMEQHHVVEKAIDLMSNKKKTIWVYPIIEGGAGSGFGGGPGLKMYDLFGKGYQFGAKYRIHINLDQYADASFSSPKLPLWGSEASFGSFVSFKRELDSVFYGIGNDSNAGNISEYEINDLIFGVNGVYEFIRGKKYFIGANIGFSGTTTGDSPRTDYPESSALFPPGVLTAFNRWTEYADIGFTLYRDSRDNKNSPSKGSLQLFSFDRFQFLGSGDYSYNQFRIDIQQIVPLWRPKFYLLLRNAWALQQAFGDNAIPFYRLTVIDVYSPLRSFPYNRFRGQANTVFNIEYHYPAWSMIDGLFFVDTGRVFNKASAVSFTHFKYSLGGGFDIKLQRIALFKFRAAWGGEGWNFIFGMTRVM